MSAQFEIRGSETGVVRVFHIDLPPEAIERYTVQAGTGEWPLKYGLGATQLSGAFTEVVDLRDLGDMPLSGYLSEAYGVPRSEMAGHLAQLDALRGHVLILPSQAFGRVGQSLTVRTPLRWVGTFHEAKAGPKGPALRSKSASGFSSSKAGAVAGIDTSLLKYIVLGLAAIVALALGFALT